jgi:REP element-mobilizing transposase RayT
MHSSQRNPGRQSLPHLAPLEFPNQSIIQYVTVCVARRREILARPEIVQLLVDSWKQADHWLVGRYVVMPDHLHLLTANHTFEELDFVLAQSRDSQLANSRRKTDLAKGLF